MKALYVFCAISFVICTLGLVSVGLKFSDGSEFYYKGLFERIAKW